MASILQIIFMVLLMVLTVLAGLFLFFLGTLFFRITLKVNTEMGLYKLSFVGGEVYYCEKDGVGGITHRILFRKRFTPFKELFARLKEESGGKEIEGEETKEEEEEEEEEEEGGGNFWQILNVLKKERKTAEEIFKKLKNFLKILSRKVRVKQFDFTFGVEDPYACGLYYAALGPFCRRNVCVTPNFIDENKLVAEVFVVPIQIVWSFICFLFSLPLLKIYRIYKKLKSKGAI